MRTGARQKKRNAHHHVAVTRGDAHRHQRRAGRAVGERGERFEAVGGALDVCNVCILLREAAVLSFLASNADASTCRTYLEDPQA